MLLLYHILHACRDSPFFLSASREFHSFSAYNTHTQKKWGRRWRENDWMPCWKSSVATQSTVSIIFVHRLLFHYTVLCVRLISKQCTVYVSFVHNADYPWMLMAGRVSYLMNFCNSRVMSECNFRNCQDRVCLYNFVNVSFSIFSLTKKIFFTLCFNINSFLCVSCRSF